MIVKNMDEKLIEQLAKEIAHLRNKNEILKTIEWWLEGSYTKCRFLTMIIMNNLYRPEYYKLSEKLENRELLLKLYNSIKEITKK
jgi:hypothetical protein